MRFHRELPSCSPSSDPYSVRLNNFYNEQSMGTLHEDGWRLEGDSRIVIWGSVWRFHRKLLQFADSRPPSDMWWLVLCTITTCIVERTKLENVAALQKFLA